MPVFSEHSWNATHGVNARFYSISTPTRVSIATTSFLVHTNSDELMRAIQNLMYPLRPNQFDADLHTGKITPDVSTLNVGLAHPQRDRN